MAKGLSSGCKYESHCSSYGDKCSSCKNNPHYTRQYAPVMEEKDYFKSEAVK